MPSPVLASFYSWGGSVRNEKINKAQLSSGCLLTQVLRGARHYVTGSVLGRAWNRSKSSSLWRRLSAAFKIDLISWVEEKERLATGSLPPLHSVGYVQDYSLFCSVPTQGLMCSRLTLNFWPLCFHFPSAELHVCIIMHAHFMRCRGLTPRLYAC